MRKAQEKNYFLLAIGLLIVSLLLMINVQFWTLAIALLLFFIGFNYLEASMPALVSRIAPAGQKGTAMGIYASLQFFGAFLGGLFGGLISGELGATMLFALCAAIGLIWFLIAWTMQIPARAQRLAFSMKIQDESVASEVSAQLLSLAGVQEVTMVISEQRCYLKVSPSDFDQTAVVALLAEKASQR